MAEKEGLAAAIEAVGVGAPPAPAEQMALLPEPALPEAERRPTSIGGRPAGSRNKRTQEWVSYLLGRGRSPLEFLHSVYNRTAEQLARELGLFARDEAGELVRDEEGQLQLAPGARLEALKMQISAAKEVAPFLHQKLPTALEVQGKTAGVILIGAAPGGQELAGAEDALALFAPGEVAELQQNQGLLEHQAEQSDEQQVGNQGK